MFKHFAVVVLALGLLAENAQAQMWGSGMYYGNPTCNYGYGGAPGAVSEGDAIDAAKKELALAEKERRNAKSDMEAARKDYEKAKTAIATALNDSALINTYIEQSQGIPTCAPAIGASSNLAQGQAQDPNKSAAPVSGCQPKAWWKFARGEGELDPAICSDKTTIKGGTSDNVKRQMDCEFALKDLKEYLTRYNDLAAQYREAERAKYLAERQLKELRREKARNKDESGTEAEGGCINCQLARSYGRAPTTTETLVGGGLAILGTALGYYGAKYVVDQNAELGWPSNPYWAAGMAYPLVSAGLYGVTGGGIGAGGFGCAGTIGGAYPTGPMGGAMGPMGMYGGPMGGAFGYPGSMMPGMPGGGMYMPGMYPGMGMGMGIGMGMGMPGMGMGMGIGMGMPGMGMGYPYAGGPWMGPGGFPGMGGMGPGMLPFPGPGMGGMYPGMGGMYPGMGGMGGMYPGMGGMGGMYPGMGGMGGMYPGMGGMGGMYPGMGGMGGMGMPYQMQMAQQYTAMMQQYMQQQQVAMQDYMYRQQTIGSLQTEMYRIQSQIYQISMGGYTGGMGPSTLPYPGPGYGGGYPTTPGYPSPYTPPGTSGGTGNCPAGQTWQNGYCIGTPSTPRSSR